MLLLFLVSLVVGCSSGYNVESKAHGLDFVKVKILSVECQTHITINPLSRNIPTYRIRGLLIAAPAARGHLINVSITPAPFVLENQNYKLPVSLSGHIGNTPIQLGQEFQVEALGPVIPIDIIGTPEVSRGGAVLNSPLMAGFYTGSFSINAWLAD